MKISSIYLQNFKRFTDLKIQDIPETAKLVILLGPSGCGKSSLFDAMHWKSYEYRQLEDRERPDFHFKMSDQEQWLVPPNIEFHKVSQSDMSKAIYVRSTYRTIVENGSTVTNNFQRLTADIIKSAFRRENCSKTLGELQDETFGELQAAVERLFSDLVLNNPGNPLKDKGFTFNKGTSSNFLYNNLSDGQKSAFESLLDIFLKREEYDDTVFCIDEPEAHMDPRLQRGLLEELFRFVNDKSQLWIATHAVGMMQKALQLYEKHKGQVIFLDFNNRDFDNSVVIKPTSPDRRLWKQTYNIDLDGLAALVMPKQIVICEGSHGNEGFDAECYNQIFSAEFPGTEFVSGGGKRELRNYISVVSAVAKGAKVFGLRDLDHASQGEVRRLEKKGIKVLQRGQIENYLLDDDVLKALCQLNKLKPYDEKVNGLIRLRDNTPNIKDAANQIRQKVLNWGIGGVGETREGFLRDTLAPLIKPGMSTYDELKDIIFNGNTEKSDW